MSTGDDIDARFNELIAQIDHHEQRRMRSDAVRAARPARRSRRWLWMALWVVGALLVAAGALVALAPY